MEKQLYDINTVCKMLNITSRTLRFWEEKGIICKANIISGRRKYTAEQIDTIKKVAALRAVGLPVKDIKALQDNRIELRAAIDERRAAVIAAIEKKQKEIYVLYNALSVIDGGGDLYSTEFHISDGIISKYEDCAYQCAHAVVFDNEELLYSHFSDRMREYLPPSAYRSVRRDVLSPLGSFIKFVRLETDEKFKNIVYQYAEYEKMGLRMKFVFGNEKIEGFWMTYYEI